MGTNQGDQSAPVEGEDVVKKDVTSGFVGTALEILLRRRGIARLVALVASGTDAAPFG